LILKNQSGDATKHKESNPDLFFTGKNENT